MKTITLVRHGKSSWEYDVIDYDRPLKQRGIEDSKLVAKELEMRGHVPNVIFSSPANRALSTCKVFLKSLKLSENQIIINEDLYDFEGRNVINFIKNLSNDLKEVMIFGHNHAFTSISNIFGDTFIDNLPTSGLVKINFDIEDWKDLKQGTTEFIIIPKDLRE
ncbi:Phosphoglycerate/bisphosphoglycerate mutase [Winogradskyella psychrotolerans RS-3]|uniref:Phosphoglycerate/bisphosphoglycerate mutase n=1 Tax=Winogradskyella psychrotolerans RS-3 TaxID=641526 RepID=S7VUI2_9FLAO|nr:histidine phosphatase family protein [Winogradskyella psychrotolerans]EPR73696.1 Phosphoglycerate/bisphosphoglycerate mutase [Winogradskyella psychrotolerans RS-3]